MSDPYIPGSDGNEEIGVMSPDAGAMGMPKPGPRLESPGAGGPKPQAPEQRIDPFADVSARVKRPEIMYHAREQHFAQDHDDSWKVNAHADNDPNSEILQRAEQHSPDKKNILRRMYGGAKNFAKEYVKNLDPRGKDKIWWAGNLLSTSVSAYLAIQTGGASLLAKSVGQTVASMGFFAGERAIHGIRKGRIERKYAPHSQPRAEKLAQLEAKHERGTGRMRRFFLGMSAGSVYGGIAGVAVDGFNLHLSQVSESKAGQAVSSRADRAINWIADKNIPLTDSTVGSTSNTVGDALSNAYTEGTAQHAFDRIKDAAGATGDFVGDKTGDLHHYLSGKDNFVGDAYRTVTDTTTDIAHDLGDTRAAHDIRDLASDTKDKLFGSEKTTEIKGLNPFNTDQSISVTTGDPGLIDRAFDAVTPDNVVKEISHAYETTTPQDVIHAVADKASVAGEKAQEYYANALNSDVISKPGDVIADAAHAVKEGAQAVIPNDIEGTLSDAYHDIIDSNIGEKTGDIVSGAGDLAERAYDRGTDLASNVWDYFTESEPEPGATETIASKLSPFG